MFATKQYFVYGPTQLKQYLCSRVTPLFYSQFPSFTSVAWGLENWSFKSLNIRHTLGFVSDDIWHAPQPMAIVDKPEHSNILRQWIVQT